MKHSWFWMSIVLGAPFAAAAQTETTPQATQVLVGGKVLDVPPPEGFVRCDGILPSWDQALQSMLPATNRLLAAYGIPEDQAKLKSATPPPFEKNFNIQVTRSLENQEVGERAFRQVRDEMKAGLKAMSATIDREMKKVVANGNRSLEEQFGVDEALKISNTVILGELEDTGSSFGFTMAMNLQDAEGKPSRVVVAAIMAPVNGRLMNFYATGPFTGPADRRWAESAVQAWHDTVVAANPKVAGMPFGFDLAKIGRSTVIGAIVGAVIGLGVWLGKKRKARPTA